MKISTEICFIPFHIMHKMYTSYCFWEQGTQESIWSEQRWSDERLEKTA
jgi:hypothetical protein